MSAERPALLMAGGRPRDPASTIRVLSRALQECAEQQPKIAYIGTASEDNLVFFNMIKQLLKKAGADEVQLVRLAKAAADVGAAKKTLEAADAIFISGGEVEDGMRWLAQHQLVGFLKDLYSRGKLFLGMSAGSIMMGSHWVRWDDPDNDDTAALFDCLGFIPTVFDTHAEDEDWKELKAALKLLGPGARGYGIPRDGMLSADSAGTLVAMEKEPLCYVNKDGLIQRA